ncbi:uncharacterized protein LOC144882765 isoform X2 [Branchiostoma floridae x Branchiostoma japonicum]
MASSHIITIPFQEQERRLLSQLNRMREQDQLCDMTVRVGTREFRCHQAVLAASSGHFLSVFVQGVLSFPKILDLTFTSADVFSIILDFIYTASLKCPADVLSQVLQAAKDLEVHTLVDHLLMFSASLEAMRTISNMETASSSTNLPLPRATSNRETAQPTCTNLPVPLSVNTVPLGVRPAQPTRTNLPVPSGVNAINSGVRSAQPISAKLPVPSGVNTVPSGVNTIHAGVRPAQISISANLPVPAGLNSVNCGVRPAQLTCTNLPVPSDVRSAHSTCTNLPVPVPSSVNTVPAGVNTLPSGVNTLTTGVRSAQNTCTNFVPGPVHVPSSVKSLPSGVNTLPSGLNTPMSGVNTPVSDVNTPLSTPSPGGLESVVVKQEEQEFSHEDTRPQSLDSTGSQNAELRSEVTSLRQQISDVIGEEIPPAHSFLALGPDQVAGERELYPGSGVFIHQSDLQILVHRANYSGRQLCHNLFDHLHRDVDLTHYSAFHTKHGFGKTVLDQNVLEAIEAFVLMMTMDENWKADISRRQIRRIFGNKCTAAVRGIKRKSAEYQSSS